MPKIDKRRHYILVIDTETANTIVTPRGGLDMSNALVYDCSWQVIDKHGTVYESASYINRDIFLHELDLMNSAYYADKRQQYWDDEKEGKRKFADTYEIRQAMIDTMQRYNIKHVAAHNARFDYNALNQTQRWVTKSKYRWFFPYDTIIWDTMRMAQDVICKMPTYRRFCERNGYITKRGQVRKTAEILYRFISRDNDFKESHTGLEDVEIEAKILAYCFRQHKKMRKELWGAN